MLAKSESCPEKITDTELASLSRLEVAALGNRVGKFGTGLKTRFIYAATLGNDDGITFTSLLKYDLEACPGHMVVGQIDLGGPNCLGGEPAFVSMDPKTHKGKPLHIAAWIQACQFLGWLVTCTKVAASKL